MGKTRDRLAKVVELAAHDKPAALQAAIMLLRSVGVHRMSHLLRVSRPVDLENATEAHDQLLLQSFSKMLGATTASAPATATAAAASQPPTPPGGKRRLAKRPKHPSA